MRTWVLTASTLKGEFVVQTGGDTTLARARV